MLEEMGAITKQSTSTIAMIGSTACSAYPPTRLWERKSPSD